MEERERAVDELEGLDEGFPSLGDPERQKCIVYGRRERYYCLRVYSRGRAKASEDGVWPEHGPGWGTPRAGETPSQDLPGTPT